MLHKFRWKLFFVLFILAIVISMTIATVDFIRLIEEITKNDEFYIDQAEDSALHSLSTFDTAFTMLEDHTEKKLKYVTAELQGKYDKNPDFNSWDFEAFSELNDLDIYIIDQNNIITYTNIQADLGMNFDECCNGLAKILDQRRETGEFYIDEIDVEQNTGQTKTYSYMATKDKKYIIELGYAIKNEEVFQEFNFLTIIDEIQSRFDAIIKMNLFSYGGYLYGEDNNESISTARKNAVKEARDQNKTIEIKDTYDGHPVIFRYVPYIPKQSAAQDPEMKILEIIYNKQIVTSILKEKKQFFILQLLIILIVTILIALIISNWFSKSLKLAFTDSLTLLKNRAAFDHDVGKVMKSNVKKVSLLMMDLDNFKLVNDLYGHQKGDELLKLKAAKLKEVVGDKTKVYRLGGDEFVVLLKNKSKDEIEVLVQSLIESMKEVIDQDVYKKVSVSISIGIADSIGDHSINRLYKEADAALYKAKENGKNNYQFYHDIIIHHESS